MSIIKKYAFKIKCSNCGKIDAMSRSSNDLSNIKCSRCKKTGYTDYIKPGSHKSIKTFRKENAK